MSQSTVKDKVSMTKQIIYFLAAFLVSISNVSAQNLTALCEEGIGGVNFSQSSEEVHAMLSNKYAFKFKMGGSLQIVDSLSLATYKQDSSPGDGDSSIIYTKAQSVHPTGTITFNHYTKVPKYNHHAWKNLDWDYGRYVQKKMDRFCTPENITAKNPRGQNVATLKDRHVRCAPDRNLSISEWSSGRKRPKCHYTINIGVMAAKGGDRQHLILNIQESLRYEM